MAEEDPLAQLKIELFTENETKNESNRDQWSNKTEFLLSSLGYANGMSNVLRFPYLCYRNGGGAFLIPYLLVLCLCGIPLFFMESILGQFSGQGVLGVFKICPLLKGCGYSIVVLNLITTVYYHIQIQIPLIYIWNCLQGALLWEKCDNSWNTDGCIDIESNNHTLKESGTNNLLQKSAADEYFHNKILEISDDISEIGGFVRHLVIANIISWLIILLCVIKGVKSAGKAVYITATFPFVIIFVLFVRGITLPGAINGIIYYIYPEWNRLWKFKTWVDACNQIFFTVGPGWGGLIVMNSFNNFGNNVKMDSIIIPLMCSFSSIFVGFVVFSVIGYMSYKTGLPISKVATDGPSLAFVTYPQAISKLPFAQLWAVLFFLMLYLLAIDCMFVQIEIIVQSILDEKPKWRKYKTFIIISTIFVLFLLSLPFLTHVGMYYVQLLEWYSSSASLLAISITEVIIVGWIYGINRFLRDIKFMLKSNISLLWIICWKYLVPVFLLVGNN
ncbi:sodium- and chloride-dependent glycine transporter 1-like [Chrysoperla carnea]|uniref:sodium- and chloride-dependent glycine transporter 1-like n=1 Tax=Chrysoperla carnea TaxID=189513 RepID=UPI001D08A307|nr:sodium- and chloride-dependent glycine transporter 1-like [Chrysoperla carnea]